DGLTKACCDPSVGWDSFGDLFLSYLDNTTSNAVIALSVDGGVTFSQLKTFAAQDQPKLAVGANSVWMVWNNGAQLQASGASVTGLNTVGAFGAVQTVPTPAAVNSPNFGKIA